MLSSFDKHSCDKSLELNINLTDEAYMRELNKRYRGISAPTDVLSFSMREGQFSDINPNLLGDMAICPEIVKENALEANIPFEEELIFVVIHGILHLFGYEHTTTPEDARKMKVMSDKITAGLHEKYARELLC